MKTLLKLSDGGQVIDTKLINNQLHYVIKRGTKQTIEKAIDTDPIIDSFTLPKPERVIKSN